MAQAPSSTQRGALLAPLSIIISALACGCHGSVAAKFASWEPRSDLIPSVDPETALKRLERSRKFWEFASRTEYGYGPALSALPRPRPQYTYVRAMQVDSHRVEFTIITVEGGRVVARGLSEIDPNKLEALGPTKNAARDRVPRQVWKEVDAEVGEHGGGAPPLLIDELYERCSAEIHRAAPSPVRLYFHPTGVLMQCGRLEPHPIWST